MQALWQTTLDSLYVAGEKVSDVMDIVVDSGTTLILGDEVTVEAFYNKIAGAVALDSGLYGSTYLRQDSLCHRDTNYCNSLVLASSLLIPRRNLYRVSGHQVHDFS